MIWFVVYYYPQQTQALDSYDIYSDDTVMPSQTMYMHDMTQMII